MQKVRLYPKAKQEAQLRLMLDVTRQLYNAALQQRRDLWVSRRVRITSKQQYAEVTALRKEDERLRAVYRECADAALHRLDLAYAAFFRRCRTGGQGQRSSNFRREFNTAVPPRRTKIQPAFQFCGWEIFKKENSILKS